MSDTQSFGATRRVLSKRKEIQVTTRTRTLWRAICSLAISATVGIFLVANSMAATGDAPSIHDPSAPAPGVALDPANHPENYAKLPAHKRAEVDAQNALRERAADAARGAIALPTSTPRATPPYEVPDDRVQAGAGYISKVGCRSLFRGIAFPGNRWMQTLPDGEQILVCSGANPANPDQGWILVTQWDTKGGAHSLGGYRPTPSLAGPVTISGASGDILTIVAKTGSVFYFDVSDLTYVDSPKVEATPTLR